MLWKFVNFTLTKLKLSSNWNILKVFYKKLSQNARLKNHRDKKKEIIIKKQA